MNQQTNTIIAALQLWLDMNMGEPAARPDHLHELAVGPDDDTSLDEAGVTYLLRSIQSGEIVLTTGRKPVMHVPDLTMWPKATQHHGLLASLLVAEANLGRYPGAEEIASRLAAGDTVLTTPQATEIWQGGFGNFIAVNRKPERGIGVVEIRLSIDVWHSVYLQEKLEHINAQEESELVHAKLRADTSRSALEMVSARVRENQARL